MMLWYVHLSTTVFSFGVQNNQFILMNREIFFAFVEFWIRAKVWIDYFLLRVWLKEFFMIVIEYDIQC